MTNKSKPEPVELASPSQEGNWSVQIQQQGPRGAAGAIRLHFTPIDFIFLPDKPKNRERAHLIAAAPELLNALKAVQALLPEDTQQKVEALIAKAEDRKP